MCRRDLSPYAITQLDVCLLIQSIVVTRNPLKEYWLNPIWRQLEQEEKEWIVSIVSQATEREKENESSSERNHPNPQNNRTSGSDENDRFSSMSLSLFTFTSCLDPLFNGLIGDHFMSDHFPHRRGSGWTELELCHSSSWISSDHCSGFSSVKVCNAF